MDAWRGIQEASLRAFDLSERTARRGWRSQVRRVERWRSRLFMILQMSLAAGASWALARFVLGHPQPFLAVVGAIVCLGFSFGQRLGRAAEIAVGVTVGVFLGDLFLIYFGTGWWQVTLVVFIAMSLTTWLGARTLMATQAAIQAAVVLTMPPNVELGVHRWQDALVGCLVALAFATVAPASPVVRPRDEAAHVLNESSRAIQAMVHALSTRDRDGAEAVLQSARNTETLLSRLTSATEEGVAVVRTSPFLRRHREAVLLMADLVVPLDRYCRNLRVMARRGAVALYNGEAVPQPHQFLLGALARVTDQCAAELAAGRRPDACVAAMRRIGAESALIPLDGGLSSTVILAQARSMLVDLLELSGLDYTDARDAVPDHAA